ARCDASCDERCGWARAPPVAGEGLEHDLDAGFGADEFVGTGADRMFFETVVADLLQVLLRDDDAGGGCRGAVKRHEIGPGRLQMEAYDPRIDDLHIPDVLVQ